MNDKSKIIKKEFEGIKEELNMVRKDIDIISDGIPGTLWFDMITHLDAAKEKLNTLEKWLQESMEDKR